MHRTDAIEEKKETQQRKESHPRSHKQREQDQQQQQQQQQGQQKQQDQQGQVQQQQQTHSAPSADPSAKMILYTNNRETDLSASTHFPHYSTGQNSSRTLDSLTSLQEQLTELPNPFVSAASDKSKYDSFPTMQRSLLAETLPVAASFHPAELFGPSTSSMVGSQDPQSSGTLSSPSADGLLFRAASFLENSLNLSNDKQPNHLQYPNSGPSGSFSTSEVAMPVLDLKAASYGTEEIIGNRFPTNARGQSNDTFLLSQLLSATSTSSTVGSNRMQEASLQSPTPAASLLSSTEVHPEAGEEILHFGEGPEIFPMTLHRCLMDIERDTHLHNIAEFIKPHGRAFIVKDTKRFETEILPHYFPRMGRFASFQRQLNLYNFARIGGTGRERGAYCHELFIRDLPDLTCRMKRTKIKGLFKVPLEKRRRRRGGSQQNTPVALASVASSTDDDEDK